MKNFAINLQTVRKAVGLTQSILSEKAGLRQKKRIGDIEDGRGSPSLQEVISICNALNVSIDDMLQKQAIIKIEFN